MEEGQLSEPLLQPHHPMSAIHPVGSSAAAGATAASHLPTSEPVIEAVFVARFDVLKGNIVEWCHPLRPEQLSGMEFKVLVSGAHAVDEDFVLFQYHGLYGVACYNQRKDENAPRGAWQRSVGVLVRYHHDLEAHLSFLRGAAVEANSPAGPEANYAALKRFYEQRNEAAPASPTFGRGEQALPPVVPQGLGAEEATRYLRDVALACGKIRELATYYGKDVFRIWRAMLCRLRVLFLSSIPAGDVCQRVHAASSLLHLPPRHHGKLELPTRLYYVTVSDIPFLSEISRNYIACTTERIFVDKTTLYDLVIDGTTLKPSTDPGTKRLLPALQPHAKDEKLLQDLCAVSASRPEDALQFFADLNSTLLEKTESWQQTPPKSSDLSSLPLTRKCAELFFNRNGFDVAVPKAGCPCF